MGKKLKIVSICLIALTVLFGILCFSNIFNSSRKYYESELNATHQALLGNLDFQDEYGDYGDRYGNELNLAKTSEEVLRDYMWECQQIINEYKQKAMIFGIFAGVFGVAVAFIVVKRKREV